ncbi:Ger(x)C family spore germination protein [Petroclostridium sp. X23]|uniref:Ger(x)C family spore germination protein n=1 Tax=Petroclostridium sp. X23 TaxID=3045146 RepID=UPI0024AC87F5|nr:Ger(x)C family spore germination protein [Petroclostridium sp. X23]WHH61155.1 Ger(x)C family spore germination protein [Petroclostridium sp. X23]
MYNPIKRWMIFLNICLIIMITTGCWNNRDVTEMVFVVAVGLDKGNDQKFELTVQLAKPSVIKTKTTGGTQEKAAEVFSSKGDTIFEAVRNLLSTVNRKPYYRHVQLIVIGEGLAKEGIADALDFFERDQERNSTAKVLIAKGTTAKEILETRSEMEEIPAMHLTSIIENSTALAKMKELMFIDLMKDINSPGKEPTISTVKFIQKKDHAMIKDLEVEGAAVFKKDKLIGWLNPVETRGLLFIEDKVKSTIINVSNPVDKTKKVASEIFHSTGKMDVQVKNGKLILLVTVKEEGTIGDQQGKGDLTKNEMVKKLEEEVSVTIEEEIREVIQLAQQKYKSDIFGFGEIVHRKYTDYWKQVKDNWNEEFANTPVEIKVSAKIKRSGLIKKTSQPN